MTPIKVLLVDDDEDDYILTSEYFDEIKNIPFDITWKSSFNSAVDTIKKCKYDLFIFDYLLGAKTAFDLIEVITEENQDAPIILLTGVGDTTVDHEAANLGVYDYLVKSSLTSDTLERSIRYSLKQAKTLSALKASENKYRTIFEQSNDVIFISDGDGNLIRVSESVNELTGYSQEELSGFKMFHLLGNANVYRSITLKLSKHKEIRDMPLEILTKDNSSKPCLLSCKVVNTPNEGTYLHGVISDQTHRLKAERESLMNEKIQSAARLMRTLAHEVRNPLTNIHLAAESLEVESEAADDYQLMYINIIKRNAHRIDSLITEVLNSARQKEVKTTNQQVEPVIEKALENVKDRAAFQGIKIVKNFKSRNVLAPISAPQFEIALNNLLINAIEALENISEPMLTVGTRLLDNSLVISVADNGTGIEADKLEHLFEPYFTSKNNGIGLGLSATLSIIQAHEASIDVKSEVGKGTTFEIFLPLSK